MIVYAWKFITFDDPADQFMVDYVQFSVLRNDVDGFCRFVNENERKVFLPTTSIPTGSPHYLDSEKDVIADPREEFREIAIHQNTANDHPVVVTVNAGILNISLTDEGRSLLIAALQKSKTHGYYSDNHLDILLKDEKNGSQDSKLIIWAAYENGIVYY